MSGSFLLGSFFFRAQKDKAMNSMNLHRFHRFHRIASLLHGRKTWELVDPIVSDPAAQDDDKRNNIQTYTEIPC